MAEKSGIVSACLGSYDQIHFPTELWQKHCESVALRAISA